MTEQGLADLLRVFLSTQFSLAIATKVLGAPRPRSGDVLALVAYDRSVASLELELFDRGGEEPFLSGLRLRFFEPTTFDFDRLERRYGAADRMVPAKPFLPVPHRFRLRGFPFVAYLVLGVQGWDESVIRSIETLCVRRLPPA